LNNNIYLHSFNGRVNKIGSIVLKSILLELSCTPKPGLVDRLNSGANRDMDFNTFIQSTSAIAYGFYQIIGLGMDFSRETGKLLTELRKIGRIMEEKMFEATGGINTQKGLIFIEGLICASAGSLERKKMNLSTEMICQQIKIICKGIVDRDLRSLNQNNRGKILTNGERLFLDEGISGIRGEAEKGFPTVRKVGLPVLQKGLKKGLSLNDACVQALISIMTITQDTNVISRSNLNFLKNKVQRKAKEILEIGGIYTEAGRKAIHDLDKLFIEKGINPGGSADLLAATITLHYLSLLPTAGN